MKSWKWKILVPVILITMGVAAKYIMWDFVVSSGKRVGNLTKISKKGKVIPTWEGTTDEGSGDKLTTLFSVKSDAIGDELYAYEGKEVILYYNEHLMGWPRDTKYDVTSWKRKNEGFDEQASVEQSVDATLLNQVEKTLFCSFLGALRSDRQLYLQVKELIKKNNHFLFQQYDRCNN